MANSTDEIRNQTSWAVEVTPEVVDAGAAMTLKCAVSPSPAGDLRGQSVVIRDHGGATVVSAELTEYDGESNRTGELTVDAPVKAGAYTWSAVLLVAEGDDEGDAEISTPFTFEVKSHTMSVVVWDVPSSIVVGEPFAINVGIKCSSECRMTDQKFDIVDHEGRKVGTAALGSEPWKETAALYFRELTLQAPADEGLFQWTAQIGEWDCDVSGTAGPIPHAAGSASFGVRVVPRPQYLVTVEAIDGETLLPLAGARVVMHPYRANTNENGVAELRVAEGRYKIFVTQSKYLTIGLPVDVTKDFSTRAELFAEPEVVRD